MPSINIAIKKGDTIPPCLTPADSLQNNEFEYCAFESIEVEFTCATTRKLVHDVRQIWHRI